MSVFVLIQLANSAGKALVSSFTYHSVQVAVVSPGVLFSP